jgi:hypothetical protein
MRDSRAEALSNWYMKAPQTIKTVAGLACLAAVLLSVFVVRDDTLRIRYNVAAMRRAEHMAEVLAGVVPQTRRDRVTRLSAMLLRKDTNSGWSDSHSHHRDALVRLGYLTSQEFAFSGGAFPTGKFYTNFWPLMSDGTSSCTFMSNGVVRVFARPTEMKSWASLISELDRKQGR